MTRRLKLCVTFAFLGNVALIIANTEITNSLFQAASAAFIAVEVVAVVLWAIWWGGGD
jgi:hypothetical protein